MAESMNNQNNPKSSNDQYDDPSIIDDIKTEDLNPDDYDLNEKLFSINEVTEMVRNGIVNNLYKQYEKIAMVALMAHLTGETEVAKLFDDMGKGVQAAARGYIDTDRALLSVLYRIEYNKHKREGESND
jgi:hypothetical protein